MKKSRKAMIDAMHRELETTFKKEYDAGKVYLMAASSSTAEVPQTGSHRSGKAFREWM